MTDLGFTYYDEIPTPVIPDIGDLVASLTGQQKSDLLEGFTFRILPQRLTEYIRIKYDRSFTPQLAVIRRIYRAIDNIEVTAAKYMRGEVVITPAEYDPVTGEETSPAVYNTPPTTAAELLSTIQDFFSDDFTSSDVEAVLTKMVQYSKHDGTGTWVFYRDNVVL